VSATKTQEGLFSQEVSDPLGVSSLSRSRRRRGRLLEAQGRVGEGSRIAVQVPDRHRLPPTL